MKLIFLDVDGVLNDLPTQQKASWEEMPNTTHMNPVLCDRVKRIADATGALFVISSTWRNLFETIEDMQLFFGKLGFDPEKIIGRTPPYLTRSGRSSRGFEIQYWLNEFLEKSEVTHILILDDNSDMEHLSHRLVLTDTHAGISEEQVEEAIKLLNTYDNEEAHLHYEFENKA